MRLTAWLILSLLAVLLSASCPQAKQMGRAAAPTTASQASTGGATEVTSPPPPPAPVGAQFAWLPTSDRYRVAAWFWRATGNGKGAPAVILLHQRAKDKSSWGDMPTKLVAEGYAVIAIDLRGHGQTVDAQGRSVPLDALRDIDYQAMLNDVAAAHAYLAMQKTVDATRVAIIGASIGANLALIYAGNDRRVRAVVALSPGLDYRSLQPLPAMPGLDKRPLFLAASKGDKNSYDAILALQQAAVKDAPVTLRAFDGQAHGTDLLRAQPGLDTTIIDGFLLNYLSPHGPPPT
jgi:dienelactone hydrolase